MIKARPGLSAVVLAGAGALVLSACGGGNSSPNNSGGGGGDAKKGGTLTIIAPEGAEQIAAMDPAVVYTGEDIAFVNAFLVRTLTSFKVAQDPKEGTSIVADGATDTGKAENGGKTWSFTIRDGVTFEDGAAVTCADYKYGVSRAFDAQLRAAGPSYPVDFLDVPANADGTSKYAGPFKKTGQDLFDKAVTCSADNKTITYNLRKAVPDFNYTVTLPTFSAVPVAKEAGAKYDDKIVSSGPYKIESYKKGKGGKLVLVRNDKWNAATDSYRPAYPDRIEYLFGIDGNVSDQRLIKDSGPDQTAVGIGVQPENLAAIFSDPKFDKRRSNVPSIYTRYTAINTKTVPEVKQRQAILVALDRQAARTAAGGDFAGALADGMINPNLGQDYAPTTLWTGLLGQNVPDNGDPVFAKKLIAESGKPMPTLKFDFADTPTGRKIAAVYQDSLGKAGITITLNPIPTGQYNSIAYDPTKSHDLIAAGWGPDWPNASTVIPPLLTPGGCCNISQVSDKDFIAAAEAASIEPDRAKQATLWQALNKQSVERAYYIPRLYDQDQRVAGSKVGPIYLWPAFGSWPYALLSVTGN